MKNNRFRLNYRVLGMVIFLFIVLTGCSITPANSRKPNDDFSRGLSLSSMASSTVTFTVEPEGDLIQVVIPYLQDSGGVTFRYLQLNDGAELLLDLDLDLDLESFARTPRMVSNGEHLHLIWSSREDSTVGWGLWYLLLDQQGKAVSDPLLLSDETQRVSLYQIIQDQSGGAIILWEDAKTSEIRFSQVTSSGKLISTDQLLVDEGENPSLALDQEGRTHLVWMDGDNLKYSEVDFRGTYPLSGETLISIPVAQGNTMIGPVLGTDDGFVYIYWSILRVTGLEAGTAITQYLVFDISNPVQAQKGSLNVFPDPERHSQFYQGDSNLSQLIPPPQEDYFSTNYVYAPTTNSNSGDTLAVAVAANLGSRLDAYVQIVIGIFSEGEYQGYSVATKTNQISRNAQVEWDGSGNLHLIWHDRSSGNQVFYTTTSPQAKITLDKLSFSELPSLILSSSLEAVTGIMLFPFAFPWMFVGLVIMIIWRLVNNDEDLTQPLSRLILSIAVISYQLSKILFFPDFLLYVPFSAWTDIPRGMELVLRIGVPLLIFSLTILFAEWRRRRKDSPTSSINYYFTVIFVDAALTLAIYGVIFLGEY